MVRKRRPRRGRQARARPGERAGGVPPAGRVPREEIMQRVLAWFQKQPGLVTRLRELRLEVGAGSEEWMLKLLTDAFLFEQKVPWEGSMLTPVEIFLSTRPAGVGGEGVFSRLRESVFGLFEVGSVRKGAWLTLRDAVTGREYEVIDVSASRTIGPIRYLLTRLVPYRDAWMMTGTAVPLQDDLLESGLAAFGELPRRGPGVRCLDLLSAGRRPPSR